MRTGQFIGRSLLVLGGMNAAVLADDANSNISAPCEPKRAILRMDYAPLDSPYPRIPPTGYVEFNFVITTSGKPKQASILSSTTNWKEGERRALEVLNASEFDPPTRQCTQSIRFTFGLSE